MTLRSILFSAALVFFAFSATLAHAQLGVYGTVSVEHVTGIKCLQTVCGSNDGTINPIGGFGGVFYDFRNVGPLRLGLDLRGGSTIGNKNAAIYDNSPRPRIFSVLGGVRASTRVPIFHVRPYAEGLVGLGRGSVTAGAYDNGVQYRGFVGADIPLSSVVDFRVVELGAGALHNSGSNYPVYSISTGVVFHMPF